MRKAIFGNFVFIGITCVFVQETPKLLTVIITFLKLKGSVSDDYLLPQAIWKLKHRPEGFKQKVPPLAKSRLVVKMFDESFVFEPENYTKIPFSEVSAGDEKTELHTAGKQVALIFSNSDAKTVPFSEEGSAYKYRVVDSNFHLRIL